MMLADYNGKRRFRRCLIKYVALAATGSSEAPIHSTEAFFAQPPASPALPAAPFVDGFVRQAQAADRYALDVTVVRQGVQVISARSSIQEDVTAEISISDGERVFFLNAELAPVQGDGDGARLGLFINTGYGDDEAMTPQLALPRGGDAVIHVGAAGREALTIRLSPLRPDAD